MFSLWTKIKAGAFALAGIAVAIGLVFLKGRKAGIDHMEVEQQRKRDALQQHYDEIDNRPVDVGDAYQRLRDKSRGR